MSRAGRRRWTIAFAVCTKRHLRFERELTEVGLQRPWGSSFMHRLLAGGGSEARGPRQLKHILGEQEVEEIQAAV